MHSFSTKAVPKACFYRHRVESFPPTCTLHYPYARLVMNRHFYGAAHGLHLRSSKKQQAHRAGKGVTFRSGWRARILDDQLFTYVEYQFSHERTGAQLLRNYIDQSGLHLDVFDHLRMGRKHSLGKSVRIPEIRPGGDSIFVPCDTSVSGCQRCRTDYEISTICSNDGIWNVSVFAFRQFGDCRSSLAPEWLAMARTCLRAK
jgi:hypothetical protein